MDGFMLYLGLGADVLLSSLGVWELEDLGDLAVGGRCEGAMGKDKKGCKCDYSVSGGRVHSKGLAGTSRVRDDAS